MADEPTRTKSSSSAPLLAALAAILATVTLPGVVAGVLIAVIGVEYRRVRTSRWLALSAITLVLAVIAAGLNVTAWAGWGLSFAANTWAGGLLPAGGTGAMAWAGSHTSMTWAQIIATQLGFGLPTGFAIGAGYSIFRARARRLEGVVEGAAYSNMRPVGWMDSAREKRERARIAAGDYLQEGID